MAPMSSPRPRNDNDAALLRRHGATLLSIASSSIEHGVERQRALPVEPEEFAPSLRESRATFVTLMLREQLRGCVGTCDASQPLVTDVAANAYAAAFQDTRFPPVERTELDQLDIRVSLLSLPEVLTFSSEADLLAQLRPGVDGLIIAEKGRRAVFLPEVWEMVAGPQDFLTHLKIKAGMAKTHWSGAIRAHRFTTRTIAQSELAPVG